MSLKKKPVVRKTPIKSKALKKKGSSGRSSDLSSGRSSSHSSKRSVWDKAPDFVEGCKFCRKIRENEIVYESEHIVVVMGRQHHKGHLVVATRKHVENMFDLPEKALDSFVNDTIKIIRALDKVLKPATTNLEYLDNWDFHVHWNIYPRFKSDPDYGNPPIIPPKGVKFKEKKMTKKEMAAFMKEIEKIKAMW